LLPNTNEDSWKTSSIFDEVSGFDVNLSRAAGSNKTFNLTKKNVFYFLIFFIVSDLVGKDEKATGPPSNLHPATSTPHPPAGVGSREIPEFFTLNFEKK